MARSRLVPGIKLLDYGAPDVDEGGSWGTARVYVKKNRHNHPCLVTNEFLCARLAAAIGLPTPPGEIGRDEADRLLWVTTLIAQGDEEYAPEDPHQLAAREPDLAAGMFVFDVWILNVDRNDENVVSHPRLGLWAIDHEQALAGENTGSPGHLPQCRDRSLGWHVFCDCGLEEARMHAWGERVRGVPRSAIARLAAEGLHRGLYQSPTVTELVDFLTYRQQEIHQFVRLSLPAKRVQAEDDETLDLGGEV